MQVATFTIQGNVFRLTPDMNDDQIVTLIKKIGTAINNTEDPSIIVRYKGYQIDRWGDFTHTPYTDRNGVSELCPNYFRLTQTLFEISNKMSYKILPNIFEFCSVIIYKQISLEKSLRKIIKSFTNLGIYTTPRLEFYNEGGDVEGVDLSDIVITELGYIKGIDGVALRQLLEQTDYHYIKVSNTITRDVSKYTRPNTAQFNLWDEVDNTTKCVNISPTG